MHPHLFYVRGFRRGVALKLMDDVAPYVNVHNLDVLVPVISSLHFVRFLGGVGPAYCQARGSLWWYTRCQVCQAVFILVLAVHRLGPYQRAPVHERRAPQVPDGFPNEWIEVSRVLQAR